MTSREIAERIERELEDIGRTKMWLYAQSGISRATFSLWKNGKAFPSTEALDRVSRVLGLRFIVVEDTEGKEGINEKTAPSEGDGLDAELIQRLIQLTPEEVALVDAFVQGLLAKRAE